MKPLPPSGFTAERQADHLRIILSDLGAEPLHPKRWVLRTSLEPGELPSLWLALVTDLLIAGTITAATDVPAVKTKFGLHIFGAIGLDVVAAGDEVTIDISPLRVCPKIT